MIVEAWKRHQQFLLTNINFRIETTCKLLEFLDCLVFRFRSLVFLCLIWNLEEDSSDLGRHKEREEFGDFRILWVFSPSLCLVVSMILWMNWKKKSREVKMIIGSMHKWLFFCWKKKKKRVYKKSYLLNWQQPESL